MSENTYPKMAQGQAVPATSADKVHDQGGITYPNLHRRIDNENTPLAAGEVAPDEYLLSVGGVDSYRNTRHTIYDEDSTTSEIP